tara:strand:+ start:80 stop:592 length:513 start_codon:yes stop_codon:yes gene_type:complete
MTNSINCPVPSDQIPIKEYEKLSQSFFFRWPIVSEKYFYKNLFICWIILLPFITIIFSGSDILILNPFKLILVSLTWSLIIPIFLVARHLLSWNYIYKRLRSENIEYEESGWYDGQIWEKSIEMRQKDLLTAQHELKPIITLIQKTLFKSVSIFTLGFILSELIPINSIN